MSSIERLSESKNAGIARMIVLVMTAVLAFMLLAAVPALQSAYADEDAAAVAAEAVATEEVPDDEAPLASFDLAPQCWTHWLFAFGAMATVLYCGYIVMNNRRDVRQLKEFEQRALGYSVASDAVASEVRQQV